MEFKEKLVVITGGGNGIGAGISEALAKEGAIVVIADQNLENANIVVERIKCDGGKAFSYKLDVSNSVEVDNFGKYLEKEFDGVDYWVNNAGISKITPYFEHTEELWDKTLDVNLKGQFLCNKIAVKHMLKKGKGAIVNISSQSGKVGTSWYQAYCSSKFGVIGLTQSLAAEFGPKNIRVNSIAPGVVYTPMWEKQKIDYASKRNLDPDKVMDYFKSKIPLRRLGTTEDIANCVKFLLSDKASYITGQTINLNGGDIMF